MTRQKNQQENKRRHRKGESNDSPIFPDRRVTSDIPSGVAKTSKPFKFLRASTPSVTPERN